MFIKINSDVIKLINELDKSIEVEKLIKSFFNSIPEEIKKIDKEKIASIINRFQLENQSENNELKKYTDFIDLKEYRNILMYCQIANIFENNGDPAEHALKLSIIFKKSADAFKAITCYAESDAKGGTINANSHFVYNACSFSLPINISKLKLFEKYRQILASNLMSSEFKYLFSLTNELEELWNNIQNPDELMNEMNLSELDNEFSKDLANFKEEFNKKFKMAQDINNIITREKRLDNLFKYAVIKYKKDKVLLKSLSNNELKNILFGLHAIHIEKNNHIEKLFIDNGLSFLQLANFKLLDKKNSGKNIPNVPLDLKIQNGYYIRKLDVANNESDAVVAALLGKFTNCCQYLGGAGEQYVLDGLINPNSGFYILCKGQRDDKDFFKKIIAQSYVWLGKENAMVFDSIEYIPLRDKFRNSLGLEGADELEETVEIDLVETFEKLANKLFEENKKNIKTIMVGMYGKTPAGLGIEYLGVRPLNNFFFYNDSERQNIICDVDMPYLKIIMNENLSQNELEEIQKESLNMLLNEMSNINNITELFKNNFMKKLFIILSFKKEEMVQKVFGEEFNYNEYEILKEGFTFYFNNLHNFTQDYPNYDSDSLNIFRVFPTLLLLPCSENFIINLMKNGEIINFLKSFTQEHLKMFFSSPLDGLHVISRMSSKCSDTTFESTLLLLEKDFLQTLINKFIHQEDWSNLVYKPSKLKYILSFIKKEKIAEEVISNHGRHTVLFQAINHNSLSLNIILKSIPQKDIFGLLCKKSIYGKMFIFEILEKSTTYDIDRDIYKLADTLSLLPKEDLIKIYSLKCNIQDKTFLELANESEQIKNLLNNVLNKAKRLEAILNENKVKMKINLLSTLGAGLDYTCKDKVKIEYFSVLKILSFAYGAPKVFDSEKVGSEDVRANIVCDQFGNYKKYKESKANQGIFSSCAIQ